MIRVDIVHVSDDGRTETRLVSTELPDVTHLHRQRPELRDDRPTCPTCDGMGALLDDTDTARPCPTCNPLA